MSEEQNIEISNSNTTLTAEEEQLRLDNNRCRMYEAVYPEVDDLVLVQVKNVAEMGAYVELLEYNNIEGMILLSELSRRRIRSIHKLIRVGRNEVVVVLRVDKDKGYIDLSKRRVSPEDIAKCEEKFNKSRAVHSILRHVSETCKVRLEDLYKQFAWDLYKTYGHAYDAFKLIVSESDRVLSKYNIDPKVKDQLVKNIQRRLTPQAVKIRADIELSCFQYDGIEAIKDALHAGINCGTADMPIMIKLVAPPLYVMFTTSLDKDQGIELLKNACAEIEKSIRTKGGYMNVKNAARAVTERDDRLLQSLMETLQKQNEERAGDDPEDD